MKEKKGAIATRMTATKRTATKKKNVTMKKESAKYSLLAIENYTSQR